MVWEALEQQVSVCEDLDWKRALAVHMWYGCSPSAPIREALGEYMQAFQVSLVLGGAVQPVLYWGIKSHVLDNMEDPEL